MTTSKTIPGVLFVLLSMFLGLVGGTAIGSLFVPAGSGLAGSTIALGYGVVGLVIALIVGIVLTRRLDSPKLRVALILVTLISLGAASWLTYRLMTRPAAEQTEPKQPKPTVIPSTIRYELPGELRSVPPPEALLKPPSTLPLGIGMVKPRLVPGQTLHFFAPPDLSVMPYETEPIDSLTFTGGPHYVDIATAPPWFRPEVLKLDYDLLYIRAITISKNWVQVIVNRETGQTSWVNRHTVDFIDWPTFLLNVSGVEVIDVETNPIRIKPLGHASILIEAPGATLATIAVQGSWIMVSTLGLADRIQPTGWIRWNDGEKLLVKISMLS